MFTHIRRHQKWLWIFISAAVIISFVWYFFPNQQMQQGGGGTRDLRAVVGSVYGQPVTLRDYHNAQREFSISYLMRSGNWPENDQFARQMGLIERETGDRLILIRKLKELDVQVDDSAVADWITTFFSDRQTKQYNPEMLKGFKEVIKRRMSEDNFERFVRNQVGIEHMLAVAGAPGKLVPPQAVEKALRQEKEKLDTKLVVFPLSNYLAKVQVTPEAIANYYTNSVARYQLPQRVQLSYVAFLSSNYFGQAEQRMAGETNLNQEIEMAYMQRGPQFFTGPDGQPLTPEAAKQQLRNQKRDEYALSEARKAAFDLANELEQAGVKPNPENPAEALEKVAAAKGLTAQVTQPFSQFAGPTEMEGLPEQFAQFAFQLTPEDPTILEPIEGQNGIYMFALKRKVPSELEPLDKIKDKVAEDYRRMEGLNLAREAANAFVTAATNAGANFDAIAQQQGLQIVDLPPITQRSSDPIESLPPLVDAGALRSAVSDLKPGEVSPYVPTREAGFVAMVEKVIPPTEEEVKEELPQFLQEYRRRMTAEAYSDWLAKERQVAQLKLNTGEERGGQQ